MGRLTVQIDGRPDLARDIGSHAVVCTDTNKLREAKERKRLFLEEKHKEEQRLQNLESDVGTLKDSLGRIENLLQRLLNKEG